jgi:hypothetical protein
MYGLLWRLLPGPWQVRVLLSLVLLVAVVAVCFLWLFPAIAPYLPFNASSVQTGLQLPGSAPTGDMRAVG